MLLLETTFRGGFSVLNSVDRGAWRATVHGVSKSGPQLSTRAYTHTHTHTYILLQESKERAEFLALLLSSLTRPRLETTAEANNPGPGGMCEIEDSQRAELLCHKG